MTLPQEHDLSPWRPPLAQGPAGSGSLCKLQYVHCYMHFARLCTLSKLRKFRKDILYTFFVQPYIKGEVSLLY